MPNLIHSLGATDCKVLRSDLRKSVTLHSKNDSNLVKKIDKTSVLITYAELII